MSTPTLRHLTPEDFGACQFLWRRCAGVVLREWESPQTLAALLTRNPGGCWAIEKRHQLVGPILSGHDGWHGYIYHAAVDPALQRSGLGSMLVHQALAYFSSQGIQRIHVLVNADNLDAQAFWQAMGALQRKDVDLFTLRAHACASPPVQ